MWYLRSVLSAVSQSVEAVFTKNALKNIDPLEFSWIVTLPELIFLITITYLFWFWTLDISPDIIVPLIIVVVILTLTRWTFSLAIQKSEIWIVYPLIAFLPVFTAILAIFMLGEIPTLWWRCGMILILIWAFWLQYNKDIGIKKILLAPFTEIWSQLMILNCFLRSITNVYSKIGVEMSNPFMFAVWTSFGMLVILTLIVLYRGRFDEFSWSLSSWVIVGALKWVTRISLYLSYLSIFIAYSLSIKRLSWLFTVILGYFFLQEKNIRERVWASLCMLCGVVLLMVLG